MKKTFPVLIISILLFACNNSDHTKTETEKKADSLYKEVDDLHASSMAKSFQMEDAQKKLQAAIDSISKLPANLKDVSTGYKFQLDSLLDRMKYAGFAMEKWMEDFKQPDSVSQDYQKQIEYLASEKLKISRVKEIIMNNIHAADSLLHKKNLP
jgi:hypothetical protein